MINDQCGFARLWSSFWMTVLLLIDSALLSIHLAGNSALHSGVQRKGTRKRGTFRVLELLTVNMGERYEHKSFQSNANPWRRE